MASASKQSLVLDLVRCTNFAAIKHKDQRRKDLVKTPYINHPIGLQHDVIVDLPNYERFTQYTSSRPSSYARPLDLRTERHRANLEALRRKIGSHLGQAQNVTSGVANILAEEGDVIDVKVIQAALLHDTVEDTDTTLQEIKCHFGEEVAGLVAEVTDDKSLEKLERKRLQIQHAPHLSSGAKLVKLADKLYNLRDLNKAAPEGWSEKRVQEYFQWAAQVVKGLRGTNTKLEAKLDELFKDRGVLELSC